MRIEVEKQIDERTVEVYAFNLIDTNVVFIGYVLKVKPEGKRNWVIKSFWDNYRQRDSNVKEPELPLGIRADAFDKACERIKVKTWAEYKGFKSSIA